jgi:hypothetical protein
MTMRRHFLYQRRGSELPGLLTLIESLVIAFLVILMVILGYKVYQAFFGPDKTALNTYHLLGDNVNSLLKDSAPEKQLTFLYTFSAKKPFRGTVFAVSGGKVVGYFPRIYQSFDDDDVAFVGAEKITSKEVDSVCISKACLCFSRWSLTEKSEELSKQVITRSEECRSFSLPPGVSSIVFEFPDQRTYYPKDSYPNGQISKRTSDGVITITISVTGAATTNSLNEDKARARMPEAGLP